MTQVKIRYDHIGHDFVYEFCNWPDAETFVDALDKIDKEVYGNRIRKKVMISDKEENFDHKRIQEQRDEDAKQHPYYGY